MTTSPPAVRLARPAEASLLQQICLDADEEFRAVGRADLAGDPFPLAVLARAIAAERVLVSTSGDGVPAGWVLLSFAAPEPCVAQIAVARDHGRAGHGTRLLEAAIARLAAHQHATVVLNTERDIPWNAPWYARFGFEVVDPAAWTEDMRTITDEQVEHGLDWSRRVHMRRPITESERQAHR